MKIRVDGQDLDLLMPRYTLAEVCSLAGVEERTFRRWQERGAIKFGLMHPTLNRWLFSIRDLIRLRVIREAQAVTGAEISAAVRWIQRFDNRLRELDGAAIEELIDRPDGWILVSRGTDGRPVHSIGSAPALPSEHFALSIPVDRLIYGTLSVAPPGVVLAGE